jgi:molybdopterin adenylyltransferase
MDNETLNTVRVGILTVSDRASRGEYEDLGGPALQLYLERALSCAWQPVRRIVPDEKELIEKALIELADIECCCLIVTTGGTGPAVRDVTPEATEAVCSRMLPGFGELMRAISLQHVPTAILSRQTAGVRGRSLIVNLPGKPRSIAQCLDAVMPAIPYCVDLIDGPRLETDPDVVKSWRPG